MTLSKRIPWTDEQKRRMNSFFGDHIKNKRAPKKHEVEEFLSSHIKLFENKNWVKIEAYVYICYK